MIITLILSFTLLVVVLSSLIGEVIALFKDFKKQKAYSHWVESKEGKETIAKELHAHYNAVNHKF